MLTTTDIAPPEIDNHGGGEEEQWSSICVFDEEFTEEGRDQTLYMLKLVNRSAAVVALASGNLKWNRLIFRTKGFMDEAVVDTVTVLRSVIGKTTTASVVDVELISHVDSARYLAEDKGTKAINITRTVLAELGVNR